VGLVALTVGLAVLAGACAFAIEYEENTHRFERTRARRRALATGAVTTGFFAALGLVLVVALLH
jgi:heme O synthase-like polyprenyltransferase